MVRPLKSELPGPQKRPPLEQCVEQAKAGDQSALEQLIAGLQGQVYALALRFLGNADSAEDATQEILVRLITGLASFEGRSAFRTWVHRVAVNALLNWRSTPLERSAVSFEEFGEDLALGLSDPPSSTVLDPETATLAAEVKVGCTLAMLQCLNRDLRLAFILGEILEIGHQEGAAILNISPGTYRKRLSRSRRKITEFLSAHCGLFEPTNRCRCHRRVATAVDRGRVDPHQPRFVPNAAHAEQFPAVLAAIRNLDEARRAAALYRSHPDPKIRSELAPRIRRMLATDPLTPEP